MARCCALLLLAALVACTSAQEIRSYTRSELYAGQICGDDGPGWEKLLIGACPQGYNGIRKFAKDNGLLAPGAKTKTTSEYTTMLKWPFCNPCPSGQKCYEFKPGVAKCIKEAAPGKQFLSEGEVCLDFSGNNKKWKPAELNPVLYGKSCQWPQFSCNWNGNGTYTCQRIRDAAGKPVTECYRAAGGRWWGGTDQWYTLEGDKFMPCGGPNPDYKSCKAYKGCGKLDSTPFAGN